MTKGSTCGLNLIQPRIPENHFLSLKTTSSRERNRMCPLRIILIFLSATLAGFFVLRNFKSQSNFSDTDEDSTASKSSPDSSSSCVGWSSSKVYGAFVNGFWTCVDMASGRYLWRNLVSAKQSD